MSPSLDRVLVIREVLKCLDMTRSQLCRELQFDSNSPLVQFELNGYLVFAKRLAILLENKSIPVPPLILSAIENYHEPLSKESSSSSDEMEIVWEIPPWTWYCQGNPIRFRRGNTCISVNLKWHSKDTIKLKEMLHSMVPESQFNKRNQPKVHIIIEKGNGRVPCERKSLFEKLSNKSEYELVVLFLTWSPNVDRNHSDTFSHFYGHKFLIIRLGKFDNEITSPSILIPFLGACNHAVPLRQLSHLDILNLPRDYHGDIKLVD